MMDISRLKKISEFLFHKIFLLSYYLYICMLKEIETNFSQFYYFVELTY
jgi:hypothetical protein